jgi:hypothetical protein
MTADFSLDGNPADFVIELFLAAGIPLHEIARLNPHRLLPLGPDAHIPKFLIEHIYVLMHQAPLREKLAPARTFTQGCQIVSRLNAFGCEKDEADESDSDDQKAEFVVGLHLSSRRIWKLQESEK